MNETYTTLIGNVCSDVKQRRTMDGVKVVNFRAASNERKFDRNTGQWTNGDQFFVNVTCWRRVADGVAASLGKGDPVVITGRLYTRNYEYEGQRRNSVELDALSVGPDLARCTAEVHRNAKEGQHLGGQDAPGGAALVALGGPDGSDTAAA